jgi:PadR family transcriptional regulator PadR
MPTPSSPPADAPLGTFEEQVLLAVLRTSQAEEGNGAYGIGAVYATLDRLEAKGLASSGRGETGSGNSRRVFAVTPRGARALADSREMRERLWRGVDLVPLLGRGAARGST